MFCCVFKASQCFQTPFSAVYLSAAGPRASLYYVNDKVGNKKFDPSFEESTSKTSPNLKFAWKWSTRLPASPYVKKDDVRSFLGSSFSEKFIYWDTGLRWKQSWFQIGRQFCRSSRVPNSLSNLGTSTKMCPTGGIYVKPLARNKLHTPPPG